MNSTSELEQPKPVSAKPVRPHSRIRWVVFGLAALVVAWLGIDLFGSHSTDIREFDPNEVARLETAMWRSYYDKERLQLFEQLAELLRKTYHFPLAKSHTVAFQASKAAFVFKDGHGHADYEKALPNLVNYYSAIQALVFYQFESF